MKWAVISIASTAIAFCSCLLSAYFSARSAAAARESQRTKPALSESRLRSVESSIEEIQGALTDLANRVKMMRVRTAANHVDGVPANRNRDAFPDPYRDPDGWRAAMNDKLARAKHGI